MKTYLLLFLVLCGITVACTKNKGTYFNPQQKMSSLTDEEKAIAIEKKRKELMIDPLIFNSNNVKLTILVPAIQGDITNNVAELLQSKMLQISSINGICGFGGDPSFVLATLITPIGKGITSTAPTKMSVSYNFTLYVANIITGDIYGSLTMNLMGIGETSEKATINAVNSIKNTVEMQDVLHTADTKIIDYYENNPQSVLGRADRLESQNQYDLAYLLLSSIPNTASKTFQLAQKRIPELQRKCLLQRCEQSIANMKDAIMKAGNEYSEDVAAYYKMIPLGSLQKKEADKLYNSYISLLEKSIKDKIENQYYLEKEELACRKLEAQQDIESNKELFELYKQQSIQESTDKNNTGFGIKELLMQVVQFGGTQIINLLF